MSPLRISLSSEALFSLHVPVAVLAWAIGGGVLVAALVSLGRWVERQMAAAEFRRVRRAWREDVAVKVGCGPYPPERRRGSHRKPSGRHRQG